MSSLAFGDSFTVRPKAKMDTLLIYLEFWTITDKAELVQTINGVLDLENIKICKWNLISPISVFPPDI
jgi:hypothetical protein